MPTTIAECEKAFEQAYIQGDSLRMMRMAQKAVRLATGKELQVWAQRLDLLYQGKVLKYSKADIKEIR